MKIAKTNIASLFVITAAILWGVDGIALRPTLYNLPVTMVVFIESAIVALILSPFLKKRFHNLKKLDKKDWYSIFGVAVFGGVIGTLAITKALFYVNYVNLSIVIFIQKLQPIFALLLARIILREKLPKIFFYWAALALIGTYFMTFGLKLPDLNTGKYTLIASLLALIASFSYGSSTVLSKRALKNLSFEMGTYLRFVLTSIILIPIVLFNGSYDTLPLVSNSQWIVFFVIALSTGGPAIFLYYYGLKNISASSATVFELAFPLTAVLLEYFLHGNILSIIQWLGVAVLMFSMWQVTKITPTK